MLTTKKVLPVIFILGIIFSASYYFFSTYRPGAASEVRGAKSDAEPKSYLESLPLPSGSKEVGRNNRDGFSQITVSSPKSSEEIHSFFNNILTDRGWKGVSGNGLLSSVYIRDEEKLEVSVLTFEGDPETVFSISYSD